MSMLPRGFAALLPGLLFSVATAGMVSDGRGRQHSAGEGNAANPGKVAALDNQRPIEREIGLLANDVFSLRLRAGQFASITVEPKEVDVRLSVIAPGGRTVVTKVSSYGAQGLVDACFVASTTGDYKIGISATDNNAHAGRYRAKVDIVREATALDKVRGHAETVLSQAQQSQDQGTAESQRSALGKYRQALPLLKRSGDQTAEAKTLDQLANLEGGNGNTERASSLLKESLRLFQAVGDRRGEAMTQSDLGSVESDSGENTKALADLTDSLSIRREVGDERGEGETLEDIATVYENTSEAQKALESYNEALALRRKIGDRRGEAQSLDDIGVVYDDIDDERKGLDYFSQALPIHEALHDLWGEALTLNNFGTAYDSLGEKKKAIEYFTKALPMKLATGNRRGESTTLSNICWTELTLDEWQSAMDNCNKALAIQHADKDRLGETQTLTNLGALFVALGDMPNAVKRLNTALKLAQEMGSRQWEAMVLNTVGLAFYQQGDIQEALERHKLALPLRRAAKDQSGEAATLSNLGKCYDKLGQTSLALESFDQALLIARTIGSHRWEAGALGDRGWLFATQGEPKESLDSFNAALPLYRALGDQRGEASVLFGIARVNRDRGDLVGALSEMESAIAIVETLRGRVTNLQLRASYFSSVREYYEFYIDLLMRLDTKDPSSKNYATKALAVSEQSRARTLLETLQEARVDVRRGVSPALLEKERAARQLLDGKTQRKMQLLAGEHSDQQTHLAKNEVEESLDEYQSVEAEIRATSPGYASLTQPRPLDLEGIRKQVLDPNTILLEYSLGAEDSYLWGVTTDTLVSFQLPKRDDIEKAARHVYDLLTARNPREKDEDDQSRKERLRKAELEYPEASLALSKMVLGPVAQLIRGKRIVVVADGALQFVPFETLPIPDDDQTGNPRRALVLDHEVVTLPSASVLASTREESSERRPGPKAVAVLADPVFDEGDSRVRRGSLKLVRQSGAVRRTYSAASSSDASPAQFTRSVNDVGMRGARLQRLLFSRREAQSILALVPKGARLEALDFRASKTTATSSELGQYRIIHFATHGLLDSEHPELSGLVLSLVDENGRPRNGFLDLQDIYNLNLPADLVVLSACKTAMGKEVKGEGLIGLTRGFMYAGAQRVIASLWEVDDVATAELMKRFYKGLLQDDMRPADALRQAQIQMSQQKQFADPYFWAAFTIEGEWR